MRKIMLLEEEDADDADLVLELERELERIAAERAKKLAQEKSAEAAKTSETHEPGSKPEPEPHQEVGKPKETPKEPAKTFDAIKKLTQSPWGKYISKKGIEPPSEAPKTTKPAPPKSKEEIESLDIDLGDVDEIISTELSKIGLKGKPEKVESLDVDLSDAVGIDDLLKSIPMASTKDKEDEEELDSEFSETEMDAFQRAELESTEEDIPRLRLDVSIEDLTPVQRSNLNALLQLLRNKGVISRDEKIEDVKMENIDWDEWTQEEIEEYKRLVYSLTKKDQEWLLSARKTEVDPYALSLIPINLWPLARCDDENGNPSTVRDEVAKLLANRWVNGEWEPGWFRCMPGRPDYGRLATLYAITKDYYSKTADLHSKVNYLKFLKHYHQNSTVPLIPWKYKKHSKELIPSRDVTVRIVKMRDGKYKLVPEEYALKIYSKWPETLAKYKKIIAALGPEYKEMSISQAKEAIRDNIEEIASKLKVSIKDVIGAIEWAKDPVRPMSTEPPLTPVRGGGMSLTISGPISFSKYGGKIPTAGDSRDKVQYLDKEYAIGGLVNAITNLFSSTNFVSGRPDLIDVAAIAKLNAPIQYYKHKVRTKPEYSYLGNWTDAELVTLYRLFISALSPCNYDEEIKKIKDKIEKIKRHLRRIKDANEIQQMLHTIRNYEYRMKKLERLKENPPSPNLIEWYNNFKQGTNIPYAVPIASTASHMPHAMRDVVNKLKGFSQLYIYKDTGRASSAEPKLVVSPTKNEEGFGAYKYVGSFKDVVDLGVVSEIDKMIKHIAKAQETMRKNKPKESEET